MFTTIAVVAVVVAIAGARERDGAPLKEWHHVERREGQLAVEDVRQHVLSEIDYRLI